MKTLIVEDDFTSRLLLQELLKGYGTVHLAADGKEAVAASKAALDSDTPYDLICLDIMMPGMDGQAALQEIRDYEESKGIFSTDGMKVIMVTALGDLKNVGTAFYSLCDAYLTKPLSRQKLDEELKKLKLI